MISKIKRSLSVILAFLLVFAFAFGANIQVNAATVEYVNGTYIYNWGNREEIATFLSPNAVKFYGDNDVTYSELASFSGSSDESDIPSSALFKELHNLMKKNHTYQTNYDATRNLFQYTDCENSGKTSKKISSFYSGAAIGPAWDKGKTWNREHTWPNSKGDKSGNGENDIMMLRPTSSKENTSRSNAAYGTNGFYDPNAESGGKHNLHGDVARIILYQYVRWECTNTGSGYNPNSIFGTMGVIENQEVLLEWIEEDPVDTWELGRNDSVESITGTRNVFVDYPELAFILFGEQVPSDYVTPSGNAKSGVIPQPKPDSNNQNNNQNNNQTTTPGTNVCKHTKAQTIAAEDPRCDIEGYTEGKYCPDCKKYISGREPIAATGHTYLGDCDNSCNLCDSLREISSDVEHKYENEICIICGIKNIETPVVDAVTNENTTDDEENSSDNDYIWWIVGAGVFVVIAVGITVLIVFRKKIWPQPKDINLQ